MRIYTENFLNSFYSILFTRRKRKEEEEKLAHAAKRSRKGKEIAMNEEDANLIHLRKGRSPQKRKFSSK